MEAHRLEIENLKWQIEYEKKLHDELSQRLENKVSDLMANVVRLNKQVQVQEGQLKLHETEKSAMSSTITTLQNAKTTDNDLIVKL